MEKNNNRFLIIDGNSIINRTFYAIRLLTTKDGLYTNAIYGFLNIYYMMLEKINPGYVAVSFDLSAPTFRHKMYSEYKAGRRSMPDELRAQMPIMKDILKAMNVPILEIEGFEADDVLGTVARENEKRNIETYILTGDRDSFQLISEKTYVVIPTSKMGKTEYTIYNPSLLKEKYGIYPEQVVDVKSLMGDSSDNIPGVPGIGEKTAYSLIQSYNTLDYILENIDSLDIKPGVKTKLTDNVEIAQLSKELATINREVPIPFDYDALKLTEVNKEEISKLFTRLQFKKFLDRYDIDVQDNIKSSNIMESFDENKIVKITDESKLKEILKDTIYFKYFDDKCKYDSFKNNIYILSGDNVWYFNVGDKEELLKIFAISDSIKIGFDYKSLLKKVIDGGTRSVKNFKEDLYIAYYLLYPDENNYTIENIAYNMLEFNMPEIKSETKAVQTSIFDNVLENSTQDTGLSVEDKKYIFAYLNVIKNITSTLIDSLKENGLYELYENIELPLIQTLADIESAGMFIDKSKLTEFGIFLNGEIEKLSSKIYILAGEEFNINSPQQLGKILFDKLQIPYYKKTKGNYSTDKETLQELEDKHEIIGKVLEYRGLAKLRSTYVDSLINLIAEDGRIHTTFTQTVTATGRLSSIEPNLQNIPIRTELGGKIRECFVAENDNIIMDADYSQIELRILAAISEDDKMTNAFLKNEDIHSVTASEVFDIPLKEVTKEERSKAKAVNFGIVYGISDYGLSKNIHSTREEAKKYIDNYLAKYHKINEYMTRIIETAKEQGFVTTLYGRKRNVPELKSGNYNTVMFGKRIAMNMPIQGTAADIMKKAMNDVYYRLLNEGLESRIIMQVHDELILEVKVTEEETVKSIVTEAMQNVSELKVPLIIDLNVGKNWYNAK